MLDFYCRIVPKLLSSSFSSFVHLYYFFGLLIHSRKFSTFVFSLSNKDIIDKG